MLYIPEIKSSDQGPRSLSKAQYILDVTAYKDHVIRYINKYIFFIISFTDKYMKHKHVFASKAEDTGKYLIPIL